MYEEFEGYPLRKDYPADRPQPLIEYRKEALGKLPPFDRIEKVIATPVRWVLFIRQQQIELTSQQLFDFNAVRMAVYEKLNLLLPRMKADEWDVLGLLAWWTARGHMHRAVYTIESVDRYRSRWTFVQKGEERWMEEIVTTRRR